MLRLIGRIYLNPILPFGIGAFFIVHKLTDVVAPFRNIEPDWVRDATIWLISTTTEMVDKSEPSLVFYVLVLWFIVSVLAVLARSVRSPSVKF